jgi:CRP-like cAMP-binding protein
MKSKEIEDVLGRCEFFKGLNKDHIRKVAGICDWHSCKAGATLFQQGDFGEHLYIVAGGLVHLERSMKIGNRKGSIVIETLGKGRVLGCWSTLLGEPHIVMSTAVCQKPTRVLVLRGARLRELMTENSDLGFNIIERLCFLLRDRIQAAYGAMDKI